MKEAMEETNMLDLRNINSRISRLEKEQKKMQVLQKEITRIRTEMRALWQDIKKLDDRITVQQKRAAL